jgi:hypothetical protein
LEIVWNQLKTATTEDSVTLCNLIKDIVYGACTCTEENEAPTFLNSQEVQLQSALTKRKAIDVQEIADRKPKSVTDGKSQVLKPSDR